MRRPLSCALVAAGCGLLATAALAAGAAPAPAPPPSHAAAPAAAPSHGSAAPSAGGHAGTSGGSHGIAPPLGRGAGSGAAGGSRTGSTAGPRQVPAGATGLAGGSGTTSGASAGGGGVVNMGGRDVGCGFGGPCEEQAYDVGSGDLYLINFYFLPGYGPGSSQGQQPYINMAGYEEHLLTGLRPMGGGSSHPSSMPKGALLLQDPGAGSYGLPVGRDQVAFPVQTRMADVAVRRAIVLRDGTAFATTEEPRWSGALIVGRDRFGKIYSVKASEVDLYASRIPPRPAPAPSTSQAHAAAAAHPAPAATPVTPAKTAKPTPHPPAAPPAPRAPQGD